jgi:hypothetical protein
MFLPLLVRLTAFLAAQLRVSFGIICHASVLRSRAPLARNLHLLELVAV